MAAGLGFKTFTTGEVLTAADVNGYLMQGILVFATEAARNAAITSPQEGQFAFTKDNNSLWYYTGSAWVASGATGDIEGVTAGVGISGGGTSGTVTITNDMATTITAAGDIVVGTGSGTYDNLPIGTTGQVLTADTTVSPYKVKWATAASGGMTLISSSSPTGVSTITFSSISQSYKHLLISAKNVKTAAPNNLDLRIRLNGITSSDYWFYAIKLTDTTVSGGQATSQTAMRFGDLTANATNNYRNLFGEFWIYEYNITHNPTITGTMTGANNAGNQHFSTFRGLLDSQQAVTSITLFDNNGNNFTGGTFYLYGVA